MQGLLDAFGVFILKFHVFFPQVGLQCEDWKDSSLSEMWLKSVEISGATNKFLDQNGSASSSILLSLWLLRVTRKAKESTPALGLENYHHHLSQGPT